MSEYDFVFSKETSDEIKQMRKEQREARELLLEWMKKNPDHEVTRLFKKSNFY